MTGFLVAVGEWLAAFALLFGACLMIVCASEAAVRAGRTRVEPRGASAREDWRNWQGY